MVRPGREGIRMARTMTVTIRASSIWRIWPSSCDRHEGEEAAGHDEADGIERAQAPQREPGPAGQQPEQGHRQAGAEVAERDRSAHHGDERGAADQDHAGEEEEVERRTTRGRASCRAAPGAPARSPVRWRCRVPVPGRYQCWSWLDEAGLRRCRAGSWSSAQWVPCPWY